VTSPRLPGVPSPDHDQVDGTRTVLRRLDDLRKALVGLVRATDDTGALVLAPGNGASGWGVALPQLHAPMYPLVPYLGNLGYTFTVAATWTVKPMAQRMNIGVRWGYLETPMTTGTGIGEYELRYNVGLVPLPRGSGVGFSTLVDAWDSGTPGTKGQDGSLTRQLAFTLPAGPVFNDAGGVTCSIWTRNRPSTGMMTDLARVAPMWAYQSGIGKG